MMRHAARAVLLQHPDLTTRAEHSAALVAEYRKSELVDSAWVAEDGSIFLLWRGDHVPSNVGDGDVPGRN